MSLCYFSLVSHYKCNAVLNITAFIKFIQNLLKDISIVKESVWHNHPAVFPLYWRALLPVFFKAATIQDRSLYIVS